MGDHRSWMLDTQPRPFLEFATVLARCRFAQATDPRDKLWSLLGLTVDGVSRKLSPSHRPSVAEIYVQTTRQLIFSSGSTYILSQSSLGRPKTISLPSWVPDWTLAPTRDEQKDWQRIVADRKRRESIHNACYQRRARETRSPRFDKLRIEALRWLTVTTTYPKMEAAKDLRDWWHITSPLRRMWASYYPPKPTKPT
jgi:hypothetical protein